MRLLHFHSALFCGTHKSLNKARVSCVYYHFLSTSPGDGWRVSARGWCRDTDSGGMAAIQLSFCLCSLNLSPSFVIVARKLSSSLSLKFGQGGQGCCAGACERAGLSPFASLCIVSINIIQFGFGSAPSDCFAWRRFTGTKLGPLTKTRNDIVYRQAPIHGEIDLDLYLDIVLYISVTRKCLNNNNNNNKQNKNIFDTQQEQM